MLLSTPVSENLRYNFPNTEITFLTTKHCREILIDNPFISRVLTYDPATDNGYCLIKNIRKQNYDLVIDLFGNPRTALITFLSGAKYKVGFKFKTRSYAYNLKVNPRSNEVHNIEFNLDALRAMGLEIVSNKPALYLNQIYEEFSSGFFKINDLTDCKIIGINACGTWETKVWDYNKFIELIRKLNEEYKILLFWGNSSEKEIALNIKKSVNENVYLIPETNLKQMSALLKKCKLFITNDSGPMHIAWTLGISIAAIFGPTNPFLQGPRNKNSIVIRNTNLTCLGCNLTRIKDCPHSHKCMKELTPEYVYNEIKNFLAKPEETLLNN